MFEAYPANFKTVAYRLAKLCSRAIYGFLEAASKPCLSMCVVVVVVILLRATIRF